MHSFYYKLLVLVLLLFGGFFTSATSTSAAGTFRSTTYDVNDFTGMTYDLTLNQNLLDNYFVMLGGGSSGAVSRGAADNFARVTQDPNGTGDLATSSSADLIRLERSGANGTWNGSVTIVECVGDCTSSGFTLLDVGEATITGTGVRRDNITVANWSDRDQVVPFGGIRGGGVMVPNGGTADHCYGHGLMNV